MVDYLSATGPIWGPDFVVVAVNDDNGSLYQLQVYPDANNEELRAAGRPQQYYWNPARVYLAKKQTQPDDFDFGMTVFKGLMTGDTTIGLTDDMLVGGAAEAGGGFCTFSTTFAVPPSVIRNAVGVLKAGGYTQPVSRIASLFGFQAHDPDPLLGIIPIMKNNVTIEVPNLAAAAGGKVPMFLEAQGMGKGSVEAQGLSSFLVTANQFAAGAIAGSLEGGISPFTVHCNLTEQVYIHACQAEVTVDAKKSYDQFSAALSVGGFLGIGEASLQYAYSKMVTSGAITTKITMNGAAITPELQDWIMKNVADMKTTAMTLLKDEIFDWKPREDSPATASRGLFSSIFGGASVSLKASHQVKEVSFTDHLELDTTIAIEHTVAGDLNDLEPAIKADLKKYLAIVDIGDHFKKVQVAGASMVDFAGNVGGTTKADPLMSVQLEVSYPDFTDPLTPDGKPNLVTRGEGFHYKIAEEKPAGGVSLAAWTGANPDDVVNISFLRLEDDLAEWPADQVRLRKTLSFNGEDPRVDLSNGTSQFVVEQTGTFKAPKMTADEAGYVFVHLMLDRPLPTENISATITATIGSRTDTLVLTAANQKDVIWQIWSDKFLDATEFSYSISVEVAGPSFTDDPVSWSTDAPRTVPLPAGRAKLIDPLKIAIPSVPADKREQVNGYIAAFPPFIPE
jgi:hypothetical protein